MTLKQALCPNRNNCETCVKLRKFHKAVTIQFCIYFENYDNHYICDNSYNCDNFCNTKHCYSFVKSVTTGNLVWQEFCHYWKCTKSNKIWQLKIDILTPYPQNNLEITPLLFSIQSTVLFLNCFIWRLEDRNLNTYT